MSSDVAWRLGGHSFSQGGRDGAPTASTAGGRGPGRLKTYAPNVVRLELTALFWLTDAHGSMAVTPQVADAQHRFVVDDAQLTIGFENRVGSIGDVTAAEPIGIFVQHARVHVEFDVDADPTALGDELEGEAIDQAERQARHANAVAEEAVARLRQWARMLHPWLAHPYARPEQVEPARVRVVDTGRVLPLAPEAAPLYRGQGVIVGQEPLSLVDIETIANGIAANDQPDTAVQLLADARYLIHWSPVKDPPRAVLVAAIGCEVKVKTVLRAKGTSATGPILDVLLDNPRAFPHSALELFDSVAAAVVGRSLRAEDRPLFRRVDALFQLRNRIAHHGHAPSADEAHAAVAAAMDVFGWVDNL